MKPRRFRPASAGERRNADLFFADLMGRSVPRAGASPTLLHADLFMENLLGEPAHAWRGLAQESQESEEWGEGGSCPDKDKEKQIEDVLETFRALTALRKLMDANRKEIDSNPLVIEMLMIKQLMDVLDMAKEVPSKVWGEIWKELKAFASCDVKPLVERVKKSEKELNAVLRVLHGFTSILQGYVHDRIDAGFKDKLKGLGKVGAKLLIYVIKKQVPVIKHEIDAKNYVAAAKAFEDLKTQLGGQGFSVTEVWDVIVTLGKEIIGNAIDDALKNGARWAAKQVFKKLLGSGAAAAAVLFILEDIAHFVHAMVHISDNNQKLRAYNLVLIAFLRRLRPCSWAVARPGKNTTWVGWKGNVRRVHCQIVLCSFAPVKDGKPGEGEWHPATLQTTFDGKTSDIVHIAGWPPRPPGYELEYQLPPAAKWPAKGDSYVFLKVSGFTAGHKLLEDRSIFAAVAVP
jgi:hypothetical protein